MNTIEIIKRNVTGRMMAGFVLLYMGVLLFMRNSGMYVADWLTGWPLILLVAGVFVGIRYEFKKRSAYYMILFGAFFLVQDMIAETGSDIDLPLWPVIIIAAGIHLVIAKEAQVHRSQVS